MLLTRRSLFRGAAALLAAPAIVRAGSLMPVSAWSDVDVIAAFWANPAAACRDYKWDVVRAFSALERSTRLVKDGTGRFIRLPA